MAPSPWSWLTARAPPASAGVCWVSAAWMTATRTKSYTHEAMQSRGKRRVNRLSIGMASTASSQLSGSLASGSSGSRPLRRSSSLASSLRAETARSSSRRAAASLAVRASSSRRTLSASARSASSLARRRAASLALSAAREASYSPSCWCRTTVASEASTALLLLRGKAAALLAASALDAKGCDLLLPERGLILPGALCSASLSASLSDCCRAASPAVLASARRAPEPAEGWSPPGGCLGAEAPRVDLAGGRGPAAGLFAPALQETARPGSAEGRLPPLASIAPRTVWLRLWRSVEELLAASRRRPVDPLALLAEGA
mmetsp:Transcript_21119/g.58589  ORF Transcript_21119/g.58589 Transcript_21119/m.58589 type:complete len:317 (+) Transcript_21119:345-1295(+)